MTPSVYQRSDMPSPFPANRSGNELSGTLAVFEPYGGAQLTHVGLDVAPRVVRLRRHQISQPVRDRVELLLDRLVGARLTVLQQGNEQERDDRRHGVDDELPGVDVAEGEVRRKPYEHE